MYVHLTQSRYIIDLIIWTAGIVADYPDEHISFGMTYSHHPLASASFSSLLDDHDPRINIFDFSIYMDQVSLLLLTISISLVRIIIFP